MQRKGRGVTLVAGLLLAKGYNGFVPTALNPTRDRPAVQVSTALHGDKFNRDINEKSRERASGEGGGEMAAGAILGGLLGGPFGAMFGAAVGGRVGVNNAFDRARKDEMKRKGITQEMLDAAEEVGYALEQSMEGIELTKESLRSQQTLARRLDSDANDWYLRWLYHMVL